MKTRGAVVIIEAGKVALIKRERPGNTYYLFPGGDIEAGETTEDAAVREAYEELGLEIRLDQLVAIVEFDGNMQYYYGATVTGGEFGMGLGEELAFSPDSEQGSYTPVWLTVSELTAHDVRPMDLAKAIIPGDLTALSSPLTIVDRRRTRG